MQIISNNLPQMETICIKCQSLFSGKREKEKYQFIACWIGPESGKG